MLGSGAKMKVIHLLRKPLSEKTVASNTLKHGTGGLNINESRIGNEVRESAQKDFSAVWGNKWGSGAYLPNTGTKIVSGRWPANMILQHLDGCQCEGTKQVRGSSAGQTGGHSWGLVNDDGWEPKGVPDQRPWMEGATEGVANWVCVEDCPVRALNEQSGVLSSGVGAVKKMSSATNRGNQGAAYGAENRPEGTPMVSYGDTGGASRFFKQIGGKKP